MGRGINELTLYIGARAHVDCIVVIQGWRTIISCRTLGSDPPNKVGAVLVGIRRGRLL